ncbi:MAG: DUF6498-containing protein, partial [Peptococcaceae bacterium]
PVIGVIFLHWQTFPLLLFFWTENMVIGFYTVLKMLTASSDNAKPAAKVFMIPFFCIHYGLFTLVHGIFVVAIFGTGFADSVSMDFSTVWQQVIGNGLIWGTLILLGSHGISFFQNYIGKNEYRKTALQTLMSQPYGRVVLLHVTIIIGGFLSMMLGSPVAALLFLIVLKVGLDITTHLKEHRKYREEQQG